jgi:hypothetical protein
MNATSKRVEESRDAVESLLRYADILASYLPPRI